MIIAAAVIIAAAAVLVIAAVLAAVKSAAATALKALQPLEFMSQAIFSGPGGRFVWYCRDFFGWRRAISEMRRYLLLQPTAASFC